MADHPDRVRPAGVNAPRDVATDDFITISSAPTLSAGGITDGDLNKQTQFSSDHSSQTAWTNPKVNNDNVLPKHSSTTAGGGTDDRMDQENAHSRISSAKQKVRASCVWRHRTIIIELCIWLLMTSWWIVGLALHHHDRNWRLSTFVWVCVTVRIVTRHVKTTVVRQPIVKTWNWADGKTASRIPEEWQLPAGALVAIATIVIGTYASPLTSDNTYGDRTISLTGYAVALLSFWATSKHRGSINWRTIIVGVLMQFLMGIFVMRSSVGRDLFQFLAAMTVGFLNKSKDGAAFLLDRNFVDNTPWFLMSVTPAVIFFIATVQMFSYWGWTQWLVGKFAAVFFHTMRVSGAEAVVASASPFLGAGESSVLIRAYLEHLTMAEMHQVMTSGFSTIAGTVLFAFINMGVSGKVVLSSCIMSIPASLVVSKLRQPERDQPLTAARVEIPPDADDERPYNALQTLADGTYLGLKVAATICGICLVLIALVALVDSLLAWWGAFLDIDDLKLVTILGFPLYPVAALCGVSRSGGDVFKVAQLIGVKIVENEFAAYAHLTSDEYMSALTPRSRMIAMYALCGFGNIGSVGIAIGVLTQLAPGCRRRVASVALSSLVSGIVATLTSACIAGMLVTDAEAFLS